MTEDPRMKIALHETVRLPDHDGDICAQLRSRIATAKFDYDHALDRALQLQALARLARLKAALAGIEGT